MNYPTATDELLNIYVKNKVFGDGNWKHEYALRNWSFNNPADMMPVVFENRISLTFETYTNEWWAMTNDCSGPRFKHTNPLRAAAIVYLMLEQ